MQGKLVFNVQSCEKYPKLFVVTYRLWSIWLHIWSILEVRNALSGMRLIPDGGGIESTITNSKSSVNSKAITKTLCI